MSADRSDDAVDRLLEQHRRALVDDLDTVLDVEAGLREVLLQSRHSSLVDDLDTVLDVEAGLTAILPVTSPPVTRPGPSAAEQDPAATERSLGLVDPQVRLTLRCHPDVVTASRNLAHASALALAGADAGAVAHTLVLDLARAGAFARARALDSALVLALDHALDLARALNPVHVDVLDLVYAHAHALIRALDRARALAGDLDHVPDIERALLRARALDADLAHDLARAHTGVIVDLCVAEVRQAVGEVLGRELPLRDEDATRAFLDDFTTADLRTADLSGIDIEGVRWSESGTRWPAEVDIEALRARSEEVGTGSGVHVVRAGPATSRDFADLA
ncbi:hypothetical protein [Streptosporangium amethystogenes]|uniref:hypothetical protein n=1 Tax=Streptosporangium amethystogenes TaxID=2002 RepID=UPI0004C7FA4A|nr:hypothetical protein [Streptosporangium amethystogenes]